MDLEQSNPYRPPAATVTQADAESDERPPAGRWRRAGTLAVDYVGFFVLGVVLGDVAGLVAGPAGARALRSVLQFALGIPVVFAYYLFFEGLWGRTPGKWVLGTRVVDASGRKPTLGTVAIRTLCRFIPFEGLTFFGRTGVHDLLSKTRVVTTR